MKTYDKQRPFRIKATCPRHADRGMAVPWQADFMIAIAAMAQMVGGQRPASGGQNQAPSGQVGCDSAGGENKNGQPLVEAGFYRGEDGSEQS
jgi:hypothetical protein